MKKILKTILLLFIIWTELFGQGENNNWIIADFLIDFNSVPLKLVDIPTSNEFYSFNVNSPSTVSDKDGNLLFFSSGSALFDSNYETTSNGTFLKGNNNGQPALFMPSPTNPNLYYLFTIGVIGNDIELRYNLIDRRLNNGVGDIVQGQKNILLRNNIVGMMAAAKGECGSIWLIVHEFDSNRFIAYKIDEEGIDEPVISEVGIPYQGNNTINPFRYSKLRISSDDKRIAYFSNVLKRVELFEFDNKTGEVFNSISLPVNTQTDNTPSGTFSDDNTKLYMIERSSFESRFYQFDLADDNSINIINSKTLIGSHSSFTDDVDMQLAPNGMILTGGGSRNMSAITTPNNTGLACGFVDTFLLSNRCCFKNSFQNLVVTPLSPSIKDSLLLPFDQQLCQNTQLSLQIQAEGDTYRWQDGSSTKDYEITGPGTYWVEVQKGNCTFTDTLKILPDESLVELGKDTTICQDERLTINVSDQVDVAYQWQDGSANTSFTVTKAGLYWVESTDSLCSYRDSMLVEIEEIVVALPKDTVLCPGQNLLLNVAETGVDYEWQDGSTQATFSVSAAGLYWVEAQKGTCSIRDSLIVSIREEALFLPNDTILCNATDYLIIPDTSFKNIIWWQSPLSGDSLLVTESGTYHALPVDNNCFYDSITVIFQEITLVLPTDTTLCMEEDLLLDVGTVNGQLTWQNGSTDQQFLITESGLYWVNLTKDNCTASDSIEVTIASLTVDLGQDTTLCENESLALTINSPNGNYEWQDGSQTQSYTVTQTGLYWAKITKDNCVITDSILINFTPPPTIDLGTDTTLCIDEILILTAPTILTNYQWQDGATNTPQLITTSGNYWLEGAIDNCTVRDSIFVTFETCLDDTQFCQAYLPNSFSPNGDGINDVLQLLTDCELQFFEMEVYDRWGSLVFSTTDVQQAWDGTANGELLDTGVYLWTVRYQFLEEDFLVEKVETVTVLR